MDNIQVTCITAILIALVDVVLTDQALFATPSSTLLKRLALQHDLYNEQEPSTTAAPTVTSPKPQIYSLHVTSHIEHRYAKTVVSTRVANPANISQEVLFSILLPETAFISNFVMEIDGKQYEAYVKEKEEAKKEYSHAVLSGQTAAHVALSARDSNRFTVSVNVEPRSKVTFNLTYEELLTRRLGTYNHVVNLSPGQIVRDMQVDVFIKESRNITVLKVPDIRSGNEIDPDQAEKDNPLAVITRNSSFEAHVKFAPSPEDQKKYGEFRKKDKIEGLRGQFIVQYDVDRNVEGGEVLVNDGYFVHFFAPEDLTPLNKHAVFVLDVSGSMEGRKIEQLKEAMMAILDELREGDYFNIIEFSYSVTVWNFDSTAASAVFSPPSGYSQHEYVPQMSPGPTPAFPATPEYIKKAKDVIRKMRAGGGTNIHDTLKISVKVAQEGLANITTDKNEGKVPEPIIVFLTDGEPTVGEVRPQKIFSTVSEINGNPQAPIFSLAFGEDADFSFLKILSLKNFGFAKKIYEAADAALQLKDFYHQIASPLLANVTFKYEPNQVDESSLTKQIFPTFFMNSELVVTGKLNSNENTIKELSGEVHGITINGTAVFELPCLEMPFIKMVSSLERLWAYLQIQQLLEKYEINSEDDQRVYYDAEEDSNNNTTTGGTQTNSTENIKEQALQLALKYSFVTPLTSLIVVKPNGTTQIGSETIDRDNDGHYALPLHSSVPLHSFASFDRIDSGVLYQLSGPGVSLSLIPESEDDDVKLATTLITLEEISWLEDVSNGSNKLLLPVGVNQSKEIFNVAINETEPVLVPCSSATGVTGICRHLSNCVLESFRDDLQMYLNYFCSIGSYAGVCCPDIVFEEQLLTTTDVVAAAVTDAEDITISTVNKTQQTSS